MARDVAIATAPPVGHGSQPDTRQPYARSAGSAPVDAWQAFRHTRIQVVELLVRESNWTDAQIARQLSLGAAQVLLLRASQASWQQHGYSDSDFMTAAPLDY